MENPWINLPNEEPYVLPEDKAQIEAFNAKPKLNPVHKIHLELLPEPFLGNPEAPVVLLNLNPGYSPSDEIQYRTMSILAKTNKENLQHKPSHYPFYLLHPENEKFGGSDWWRRKLKQPIQDFTLEAVARDFLCVEYFPYHSQQFKWPGIVPSQEYSFDLVRKAVKRNAIIIIMRSCKLWVATIPELSSYRYLYELHNVQNVVVSRGNCPEGYTALEKHFKQRG